MGRLQGCGGWAPGWGLPHVDQFSGIQHPVSVCPGITELEDKLSQGNVVDDFRSGDTPPPAGVSRPRGDLKGGGS